MKLSAFKELLIDRKNLLGASIVFTFQKETAYWTNNWTSLLSTTFYTITMLVFLNVIYFNTTLVAGYTRNEMLIFFLVVQATFFTNWGIWLAALQELVIAVNRGDLDLVLITPVPALFYVTTRRIKVFSILRDGIPPILAIILSINWGMVHVPVFNLIAGLIVFILGMICIHIFQFLACIPVFWAGESQKILGVSQVVEAGAKLTPLEGFSNNPLKFILSTVAPVLISGGFAASIILGKSAPLPLLLWSLAVTIVALYIRNWAWQKALKNYTSASS